MIGAMIARKKAISAFESLSRQDIEAFMEKWAEDAIFSCPGPTGPGFPAPVSALEGKPAITEWFQHFKVKWELSSFLVKNICIKRLCWLAFGTNTIAVEWDLKLKIKGEAEDTTTSGITIIEMKKGKAAEVRVYECLGDPIWQAMNH